MYQTRMADLAGGRPQRKSAPPGADPAIQTTPVGSSPPARQAAQLREPRQTGHLTRSEIPGAVGRQAWLSRTVPD